ncbi:MAG: hypothetical protein LDL44_05060 [Caenispirillum sp.]|nr:hypothetical protein [Caenispirillum sp.]
MTLPSTPILSVADVERLAGAVSMEVMRYAPRNAVEARAAAGAFAGEFLPELDERTRHTVITRAVDAMLPLIEAPVG